MKKLPFWLGFAIIILGTLAPFTLGKMPAADAAIDDGVNSRLFSLEIDGAQKDVAINPTLFGAFFEDINYAADGGLYAELIQNRSFEFDDPTQFWTPVRKGKGANGTFTAHSTQPLNPNNPNYLRITITGPKQGPGEFGVANPGFGGIPVAAGADYHFSVYARSDNFHGALHISLAGENGRIYAQARIPRLTVGWRRYSAVLHSRFTDTDAQLAVTADAPGTVDLDMVSLFPARTWKNRSNGLRPDLVRLLADLKPKFLRFPGGCIVEGNKLADAYSWKNSIGPVAERPMNHNLWGLGQPYPYNQTYGLGFYEFFLLCEDIGAEPLPLVNAGMACQVRNYNYTTSDDSRIAYPVAKLAESDYVQDAIDLLEFANGPATSRWGAKRAAMGHPDPFHLKYLGIGNENWGPEYQERFDIFRTQLLARSPYAKDIRLIVCSGTEPAGRIFDDTWQWVRSKPGQIALVDEHFYQDPEWFFDNVHRYDGYDRHGAGVFVGEYAAHEFRRRNTMLTALAEAAFMTGLVRNADVVKMASYAPLFNNINYPQWLPDLIFFDNAGAYGTPDYYVQKLFSVNTGTYTLHSELSEATGRDPEQERLYTVVTKDENDGAIIIFMVNAADRDYPVQIRINDVAKAGWDGTATVLAAEDLNSGNSFAQPAKVVPGTTHIRTDSAFRYTFKKYSLTVLRLRAAGQ